MALRTAGLLGVRLLGHVTLEIDGTPFSLTSPRSTVPLIGYLLLNRQAPVARGFLAYLLCPDATEESAHKRLRNNLYRLGLALPAPASHWIVADSENVQWNPDAELALDVDEFVWRSRDPERLDDAVSLYRGDLLATFYDEWLVEPRERLRNTFVATLAELVARHRRARDLPRALTYATQLLAAEPFREDVLRRLIGLRQEIGDRSGALREYEQFVRRLRDEMGIDPMPETVALRDAIARNEVVDAGNGTVPVADDATAAATAAALAARELPFVGRRAELDQLLDAWSRATRERGGAVLLGGEAGIGKSRLALEFGRIAEDRGAIVLSGSTGLPEEIPYQCLIEALRSALPLVASLEVPDVWRATLATLLPELHERVALSAPPPVSAPEERPRLFESLALTFSTLARRRPLVIILDDLHRAGESTIAALEYLLRRAALLPVLFVATYRDDETPGSHPLRRLRRRTSAEGRLRTLTLAPLRRADIGELSAGLPAVAGRLDPLCAASDGNPLILAQLIDVPTDELEAAGARGLQQLVASRYERRSDEARTIAEIAALIGPRFSRDVVLEVSGWRDGVVQKAFDELIDHRIVKETTGRGFFDYSFAHDVVWGVVKTAAPPDRAARRHRRIARVLEELGADRGDELSATIARQYDLGGEASDAAPRYLTAALRTLSLGAVDEARALAARGLELAIDVRLHAELLTVLERVAARKGFGQDRTRALERLDEIAAETHDDELRRTVLLRRVEFAHESGDREREAVALDDLRELVGRGDDEGWKGRLRSAQARRAIELGDLEAAHAVAQAALAAYRAAADQRGEAQARTQIAEIAVLRGDLTEAEALLEAARTAAEQVADPELSLHLLRMWYRYAFARRDLPRCLEVARGCLEAAIASGDLRAEADAHERMAVAVFSCGGRLADARDHLTTAKEICMEVDDRLKLQTVNSNIAQIAEILGDFAGARLAFEQCYEMAMARPEPRRQLTAMLNLSAILSATGDARAGLDLARRALAIARQRGYTLLEASALEYLGLAYSESGQYQAAIEHMEQSLTVRSETKSGGWTGLGLAELALWYAAVGDAAKARASVARMLEEDMFANATPWPQTCYWVAAQILRLCGEKEAAMRELERARAILYRELERVEEDERPLFLAIPWHADIIAATERGVWPNPPR